jgi:hypothetical protein
MQERDRMKGRRVGLVVTGQNIDTAVMAKVLAGETPTAGGGKGRVLTRLRHPPVNVGAPTSHRPRSEEERGRLARPERSCR